MNEKTEKNGLGISAKSFIGAIVIIFILMCLTFTLTFVIPGSILCSESCLVWH